MYLPIIVYYYLLKYQQRWNILVKCVKLATYITYFRTSQGFRKNIHQLIIRNDKACDDVD